VAWKACANCATLPAAVVVAAEEAAADADAEPPTAVAVAAEEAEGDGDEHADAVNRPKTGRLPSKARRDTEGEVGVIMHPKLRRSAIDPLFSSCEQTVRPLARRRAKDVKCFPAP
jgi:hypothetical protein